MAINDLEAYCDATQELSETCMSLAGTLIGFDTIFQAIISNMFLFAIVGVLIVSLFLLLSNFDRVPRFRR